MFICKKYIPRTAKYTHVRLYTPLLCKVNKLQIHETMRQRNHVAMKP